METLDSVAKVYILEEHKTNASRTVSTVISICRVKMSNSRHSKYFLLQRLPKSVWLYLFRHKRLMELDELSGRTTGRLGDTWPTTACAIGGTAAGTTILYHLRICRRLHSSSVMTVGRRELLEDGHRRRFPAGAAGPSEGLRAGRSSGRTKLECTAANG